MKIDTSSYYPKSHLDDDDEASAAIANDAVSEESGVEESDLTLADKPAEPKAPEPVYDPTDSERFIDNVSTALSWILVPLLMPVYGILLAFNLSILDYMPFSTKLTFTVIVACINMVIPALLVMLLKKFGLVEDLWLNGRKERFIPYIIT
ncbi:MAG: hypothetical protein K2H76_05405, partial [Muribaculaceae bacterium]|nr:hypothetical protein [Muribaculaceae bacterium]